MLRLGIALAWAGAVGWLLARAVRQLLQYESVEQPEPAPPGSDTVDVVIPARNEAATINRCLRGILAQTYPDRQVRVIVVDDRSSDRTVEVARQFCGESRRVRVVDAGDLPEGWTGKSHACCRGAELAEADWLCFLDADTVPGPELLAEAVAAARQRRLDMLSLEPRQELVSFWERLLMPCGMVMMGFFENLRRINDPRCRQVAANGQFLLLRRDAYEAVGGHEAVAGEISEDTALARRIQESGRRFALLGGERVLRVRMYTSLGSLWEGVSKNAVVSAGGRARAMAIATALIGLGSCTVLLPLGMAVLWLRGPSDRLALPATLIASAASAAMVGMHVGAARHFSVPGWYGLLFPLGYLLSAAILVDSVLGWTCGSVSWKGRRYRPSRDSHADVSAG
jgi:chlorobactene glucosyltransferase